MNYNFFFHNALMESLAKTKMQEQCILCRVWDLCSGLESLTQLLPFDRKHAIFSQVNCPLAAHSTIQVHLDLVSASCSDHNTVSQSIKIAVYKML